VASNATAHYIQNMLFLLGETMETSADIDKTNMECYRANEIESFDTMCFRGEANGAQLFFTASHATNYGINPIMDYAFENASVYVNMFNQDEQCVIHHKNGKIEHLGNAMGSGTKNKLLYTARGILGEGDFICTARTVQPIISFFDGVFNKIEINDFPGTFVIHDAVEKRTFVKNLHLDLAACFNTRKLPSELRFLWAVKK
jgi:hypothetical protein